MTANAEAQPLPQAVGWSDLLCLAPTTKARHWAPDNIAEREPAGARMSAVACCHSEPKANRRLTDKPHRRDGAGDLGQTTVGVSRERSPQARSLNSRVAIRLRQGITTQFTGTQAAERSVAACGSGATDGWAALLCKETGVFIRSVPRDTDLLLLV